MMETVSVIDRFRNGTVDLNDAKIRTAYALNLCTVSVSQIIDYNDVVVLEQEYEAILNNLNIERMPKDEALLKILKQLLDTITFFRIQEGDKAFIDREYQNKMKNAIWNAIPSLGLIVAGGNPVTMAISLASQVGIGYMNYRRAKAENSFAHEKQMWQLQRAAIEQFNGLRRELFDTAWRLVDAHELPDEYRLTERQVNQYNAILMDPDASRRYERLDSIKESFIAYPQFWYYFGNTANTLAHDSLDDCEYYRERAKAYYDIFITGFMACNLQRENQVASACALEYVDLLSIDVPEERKKIDELIKFAIDMSGNANDVLQLCAFAYLKIGDSQRAATIFRRLVNEGYNTIVNAQLLSGYYVSAYLLGDDTAQREYRYIKERVDESYLLPMPNSRIKGLLAETQKTFVETQRQILIEKFGLVINQFQEKYRVKFNMCIPVPEDKTYTASYFGASAAALENRKADGHALRNKKVLSRYVAALQDMEFPYNYLPVLNEMTNAVMTLNCVQGFDGNLVTSVGQAVIDRREQLIEFRTKVEEPSKFTEAVYNKMLELSFDEFTGDFFKKLAQYSAAYIASKKDIVSMNEAEVNLREFCLQQGIKTPDELYETANDTDDEEHVFTQYVGIELIDDGILIADANNRFNEVRNAISRSTKNLLLDEQNCHIILSGTPEFDKYFINLGIVTKQDIRRKTVAIFDDTSSKDNDLLFTTEGIVQIVKRKVKEVVLYDDVQVSADRKTLVLHQNYSNASIYMQGLVGVIQSLRSKPFFEVKDKKNPFDTMMAVIKK